MRSRVPTNQNCLRGKPNDKLRNISFSNMKTVRTVPKYQSLPLQPCQINHRLRVLPGHRPQPGLRGPLLPLLGVDLTDLEQLPEATPEQLVTLVHASLRQGFVDGVSELLFVQGLTVLEGGGGGGGASYGLGLLLRTLLLCLEQTKQIRLKIQNSSSNLIWKNDGCLNRRT